MHTMTYGWIGQGSFNLSRSKSRNKFFALSAWIALIYAAWRSISWYILRHFECESQSPTGSQNKRFSPALQGPRRFLHWVEGLGAESSGDCLFSMENWRIFWDGITSAACCAPSVGTRNLCHVENRNSACWTKQNTAKGAVCPVSDPAGWRLKEYILSAPWGRAADKAGMAWTSWKSDFCGAWERSAWVTGQGNPFCIAWKGSCANVKQWKTHVKWLLQKRRFCVKILMFSCSCVLCSWSKFS